MNSRRDHTFTRRQALVRGVAAPAATLIAGWTGASSADVRLAAPAPAEQPPSTGPRAARRGRIVVVGAGAFGGWTALWLRRQGEAVTLVDAWGPGNSRASSGGDTRVIRHAYDRKIYVQLVRRSLEIWNDSVRRWQLPLLRRTGMVWMVRRSDDAYERAAVNHLEAAGVHHEVLTGAEVARRWRAIRPDEVRWALWEPDAGYLLARRACSAVRDAFLAEGGRVRQAHARPGPVMDGEMQGVQLDGGEVLRGERIVFACGPWLGEVLPDVMGERIRATRQEVFTFGTPAGDRQHDENGLPVWADHGERFWYGIPGHEGRGFKIADDTRGPIFDPTSGDRVPTADGLRRARGFMERRFPGLKDAPLLEARVCAYEDAPDHHYVLDRHPHAQNAWIVGGGSGHGFKNAPAVGERAADMVLERRRPPAEFTLDRPGS